MERSRYADIAHGTAHLARSHWGWINSTNLPADAAAPTNYNAFPNAAIRSSPG